MAKAKSALTSQPNTDVKVLVVPICISPAMALIPRERIDVQPQFIDFKIAQLSNTELIDALGLVKRAGKDLEKWEKLAVDVAKVRLDKPTIETPVEVPGLKYKAIITCTKPKRISLEKLIAKFGEEALADCYTEADQYTLNIKPLET